MRAEENGNLFITCVDACVCIYICVGLVPTSNYSFHLRLFFKQVLFHSYSSYPAWANDLLPNCVSYWQLKTIKVQKPLKFIFCNILQTKIIRHVEFNTFARSFLVSNTESESGMFSEIWPNRGSQKYASYFTWKDENKLFKASVLWMNDSQIHQDMKIVRNDSAVKLGCSDWCGLPLNALERLLEQALIFPLEG